jgi:SWI/SNF-related matrix-associated actin-dependent regulator of chromatin subfamily A member 2/4
MALIAYLMEHKQNYGPHLIIVPNAVMVNWKSELATWLPSVKCVYYTGTKDERAKKFSQEVVPMHFNVLVTTYEYIMRDRSRLSRVEWKYIVIDEAQRMKDRKSKLAQDLDRFTTQRRLLLTGTPLQNELRELWSLLNLLLPEVFDDKKQFSDWFGEFLGSLDEAAKGKLAASQTPAEQELEREKRVIVVHRLHQILEPFMLRRQVQDVEGKLPAKVPVVVKCPMSGYQSIM